MCSIECLYSFYDIPFSMPKWRINFYIYTLFYISSVFLFHATNDSFEKNVSSLIKRFITFFWVGFTKVIVTGESFT